MDDTHQWNCKCWGSFFQGCITLLTCFPSQNTHCAPLSPVSIFMLTVSSQPLNKRIIYMHFYIYRLPKHTLPTWWWLRQVCYCIPTPKNKSHLICPCYVWNCCVQPTDAHSHQSDIPSLIFTECPLDVRRSQRQMVPAATGNKPLDQ